jgi:hypothetical protein
MVALSAEIVSYTVLKTTVSIWTPLGVVILQFCMSLFSSETTQSFVASVETVTFLQAPAKPRMVWESAHVQLLGQLNVGVHEFMSWYKPL